MAFLRASMEAVTLALVCVSPWVLGSVEPGAEFCLFGGVAILLALWAALAVFERDLTWEISPVGLGLAGLFLFGIFQLLPLPPAMLGWLSPQSAHLGDELLPKVREELPFGAAAPTTPFAAGATVSLHPARTRDELVRLLAVFLLFAVVRSNVTSPAALRRLAVAVLINGFALALFAFVQFFSSRPNVVYWTYPVLGVPFGPFIDRDHFPFYLNVCLGLGGGLLLSLHHPDSGGRRRGGGWLAGAIDLLNTPAALWVILPLAFMVSSVAFSLSRGGMLSLAGTCAVFLGARLVRSGRVFRPEAGLLIATVAFGLLVWFGLGTVQARLATVWNGKALEDGRLPVWLDALRAAKDYPLWGTGYGTFLDVELMYRTSAADPNVGWDNAHNDYVEALLEGGAARLLLSVVVIALVYRQGRRALRGYEGRSAHGLILGALFGFTTLVVHSFVDFGLHVPAIAVLATVVAAHVCSLGSRGAGRRAAAGAVAVTVPTTAFCPGWFARVAGALVALALGWVLCAQGWRWAQAYGLEVAARTPAGQPVPAAEQERLTLLEAATQVAPEQTHLHLAAGQAYFDAYRVHLEAVEQQERAVAAAVRAVLWPAHPLPDAAAGGWVWRDEAGRAEVARGYLTPALRHYLLARDLCPLMAKPQVRIAASVEWLGRADPREAYLRRAELVYPYSAEVWYLAGVLELKDGDQAKAWSSWRRSLELAPDYLAPILDRARQTLDTEGLVAEVLPDQPGRLWAAAAYLYPQVGDEGRRPLLRKTLALLETRSGTLGAADLHQRAQAEAALGEPQAALASFAKALQQDPQQDEWRYEYAALLHRQGRRQDALKQLRTVTERLPGHGPARELRERVARELAEGADPG